MRWLKIMQLVVGLLCCCAAGAQAADIQVAAELQPNTFALNQTATLVVTVNGSSAAVPELPNVQGLYFHSRGQSQQTSWVNGQVSASVSFTFAVQAEKPGQYTIAPITVQAEGKTYKTQPLHCTIGPARQPTPSTSSASAPLSDSEADQVGALRIIPEKETLYLGEIIPFRIKAYFKPGHRLNINSAPVLLGDNFLIHDTDEEPVQQQEQFMGQRRTSLTWQGELSAVKEGTAALSVQLEANLLVRQQRQRSPNPFDMFNDPFFTDFFDNYSKRKIKLASPDTQVTILPLPLKNRPADFNGAVGAFSLAVTAAPVDGRPGEPITLKVRIDGTGNFDRVQAPLLTESKGWKIYPASAKFFGRQGGKGKKTFEQAVIPMNSSLTAVPALHFSYFDPAAEEYVSLRSEPISLHLQHAADADTSRHPTVPPAQPIPLQKKTRPKPPPLPLEPGQMVQSIQPLYKKQWFQSMMAGAGCCLTVGLALDLRRKKLAKNPGIVRRRIAARRLARHFREMQAAVNKQDQERFQRNCREAVQTWAGAAWERAPEAVTSTDLHEKLPADSPLLTLFVQLEQSGYANRSLAQAEMKNMLHIARHELT